ncbi:MAG: AEC family transporter [Proteobacteria bacterium]|nr:AEC family transporter [Pseudomonadota bacterium]
MIQLLFNVVAPIFTIVFVGWFWGKSGRAYDSDIITSLVMTIGAPCLVFSTLSTLSISPSFLWQIGAAALLVIVLTGLAGAAILKVAKLSVRGFLSPIMFPNIGNMGLSVCFFAFGKPGLALAIIVFTVYCLGTFSFGLWLYSGAITPAQVLRLPIVYAVILAVLFLVGGLNVPEWIAKTAEMLGNFTIPLMLFTLGVSLSRLKVMNIRFALLLSALRLGGGFGIGLLVSSIFGLTGVAQGVVILQSSMPVAVFNYLFSERYQRHPQETAELVVVSTLMSLVAIPLILRFVN